MLAKLDNGTEPNQGAIQNADLKTADGPGSGPRTSTVHNRNYNQTIGYARTALERIDALRLPADPPSFEVWYTYSTGHNAALNATVNQILRRRDGMTIAELDLLYHEHLSPSTAVERVETVRTKIGEKVSQIVTKIDAAIGSTTHYKENLAGAKQSLSNVQDEQSLRILIDDLTRATMEIEQQNHHLHGSLVASQEEIKHLRTTLDLIRSDSLKDPLTGLANRKHFDQSLDLAVVQSEQERKPLSLLLCDIDHFKQFNDKYGHATGDDVLRLLASAMRGMVRQDDTAARYGGEEFAVILPNTMLQQAVVVAENISKNISKREVVKRSSGEKLGRITISVGAAELQSGETSLDLIERADSNLYAAKEAGRNRVIGN